VVVVKDVSANIVFIANPRAVFEHVDKVLDSWVELGYIPKEAKENLKENIQRGWTDRERAVRKAIRDTAFFCMTVMIVARAYGLETHPMEGFDEEKLKEFLGVDKDKVIPVMLAIGYMDPQKELLLTTVCSPFYPWFFQRSIILAPSRSPRCFSLEVWGD